MALTVLSWDNANIGMRVQDYWGRTGTIRWMGKLDRKHHPPLKETGRYYGVEYDEESQNPLRFNGTWHGTKYFECESKKGAFCKAHNIYPEMNSEYICQLRKKFGQRVASWHDFELVKFLIARRYDMVKVSDMLEKHLQWREKFMPDAEEYFPPSIVEEYPCGYSGKCDFDENLIYCERPGNGGRMHPSAFVEKYTLPVIARWHACGMEMGIRLMRQSNYRYRRVCYIVDLCNVNTMTREMVGFAQTLAAMEQNNYPEHLGRVFIVNCPTFFRVAWKMLKVFIDERSIQKITFCAPNKAFDAMKECMPEEDIPTFCGGTSTDWMTTASGRLGSSDPSKTHPETSFLAADNALGGVVAVSKESSDTSGDIILREGDDFQSAPCSGCTSPGGTFRGEALAALKGKGIMPSTGTPAHFSH